jgi:hypothetical protein
VASVDGGRIDASEVHGFLGYFHLGEWWLTAFTEAERAYIEEKYKPMGESRDRSLTHGSMSWTTQTAAGLLSDLSTWFMGPADRHLAIRVLEKAEAVVEEGAVLDRHFVYSQMVKVYYAERETRQGAFEAAVAACERQIAIGPQVLVAMRRKDYPPVAHRGFKQLAIIREKQGDFTEALRLSREASSQGWRDGKGDWSARIARLERRLSKNA